MLPIAMQNIEQGVQDAYGLYPESVKWFHSLYRKRVAARIQTEDRSYKLKRYSGSVPRLRRLHRRCSVVYEMKRVQLPTWYLAKDGRPYVGDKNNLFYLIDWVEGRPYGRDESDVHALGTLLRHLHRFPSTGSNAFDAPLLRTRLRAWDHTLKILKAKDYAGLPTHVRRFVLRESKYIEHIIKDSLRTLRRETEVLAPVIVHGDVTVPNLLYTDLGVVLIDWERVNLGFAMEELAKTTMNTCDLRLSMVDHLLDGYDLYRLSAQERAVFVAFLQIPREIVFLLHRAEQQRKVTQADLKKWQLVIRTWSDRKNLLAHIEKVSD
jgi:aminoglycoside phosphotransferase (APT) family kinase protein